MHYPGLRITYRFFCVFLFVSVLVLCIGPAHPVQAEPFEQAVPFFTPADCMFTLPAGWQEGQQVDCGYLTVPEQYAKPDGPTIQLAVAILRSQDPGKQPDPLVMLQGGPGGSTIDTYTQIFPTSGRFPGNRDVVLFDQRGTLYSKPSLTCPEFLDLNIATLNQDLSNEESTRLSLEALQKCRIRLVEEGVNLDAYDSLENAADVESLRQALGFEQINLYGVSYGTLLALHVMRDYPHGLRSVTLDSVVPTQTNYVLGAAQSENRSFEKLFDDCAGDANCNENYPNLRDVFYTLVDQLNDSPANLELTDLDTGETYPAVLDGDGLISIFFQLLYITEFIPLLPRIMFDVRDGDWAFIERMLSVFVFDRTMSYGMYYSVLCAEDADFDASEYDLGGLPSQLFELEKDSAQYILDACKLWKVDELDPVVDDPVVSEVPTLVLTGDFDPITPPEYARQAASGLSRSFFFLFPAGGHGELGSTECADNILLQFLDDPLQAPDTTCIEKGGGVEFSTPGTLIRLPILIKLLNLADGTGVQAVLYLLALLFLLTALLVYPVVGLFRLLKGQPKPAAYAYPQPEVIQANPGMGIAGMSQPGLLKPAAQKPMFYRLAPWAAWITAGVLLLFTVVLVVVAFKLAMANDVRILLGLPGSSRPLFLLPPFALLLTICMFLGAIAAWIRRAGSVWGRLYLTLLTISAIVCVGILAVWGMLGAF